MPTDQFHSNGYCEETVEPLAIVGMDCCLPGAANLAEFEELLFAGRSGVSELPAGRFDHDLYFDSRKGQPGKSYTRLGGTVPHRPVDAGMLGLSAEEAALIDPVHLRFCEVAFRAWKNAGFLPQSPVWRRTGVFVGHSGATQNGGGLNLATQIDEGLDFLNDLPDFQKLPQSTRTSILSRVAQRIRQSRPFRTSGRVPKYQAYTAASLPAQVLGLEGPRIVCDAACASSLFAMQQAMTAIRLGRIDAAIVGGATTNGVDNLILFSQSQACSDRGSCPFDDAASGLISSEGYAAVVVVPQSTAKRLNLPVLGLVAGLGIASDGRGKSLWAPRAEGQQLAIRRAYPSHDPLAIDYLEAHATSTQLGDATELTAVHAILSDGAKRDAASPLLIGSLKSNLGHTLETAGVAGLVKILLAMRHRQIPASLNYQNPNKTFDWSSGRVQVVSQRRAWHPQREQRSSAVSAFGIGGLNAHLFVQEEGGHTRPLNQQSLKQQSAARSQTPREPIAIVGRGTILPGAHTVEEFRNLLNSGRSVIGPAPAERWRPGQGVAPGGERASFKTPNCQGGFIRDYVFNSQAYRIPPKQVAQANPLQMMLLDAVTQAITELDGGQWNFDRQKTGVVIGTIFSGDFGSQLQLGLRLPEIVRELGPELQSAGYRADQISKLADDYRKTILKARPALLDETGSFTASTLASRVAKTFDLMGGACAIDVDDASGLAALSLAVDQLRSGTWEVAICGAAERAMDLSKFEQLDMTGKLVRSGRPEDIPPDCEQILPGEGAVILMLERLSVARAKGHPIYGIIEDVEIALDKSGSQHGNWPPLNRDHQLAQQIGYLTGAQSLVQLLKSSVRWEMERVAAGTTLAATQISSRTEDGIRYQLTCRPVGTIAPSDNPDVAQAVSPQSRNQKHQSSGQPSTRTSVLKTVAKNSTRNLTGPMTAESTLHSPPTASRKSSAMNTIIRLQGTSSAQLLQAIDSAIARPDVHFSQPTVAFHHDQPHRLAVLAGSAVQLQSRLEAVRKNWDRGRQCGVFETERVVLWNRPLTAPRVAWCFPGQGSQYAETPAILQESPLAAEVLAQLDEELRTSGLEPLSPRLQGSVAAPMTNIWWNQLWVLGMSLALTRELKAQGFRPDLVLGHSFGEYSAMVACGSLTLSQALRMVKSRADAVAMTVREPGQLISVRGTPNAVEAAIRAANLDATLTHFNAPLQTVIASRCDQVDTVRKVLSSANLASVVVPVPVAYHTQRLASAENLLANSFTHERFLPPTCGFLSTTTARYLAEPNDLRQTLVSHLTSPVLYVPAVERLIADGFGVLIEVGPNQILSRLNNEIVGERALCLSLDLPGRGHAERLQLLQAVMEIASTHGVMPVREQIFSAATPGPIGMETESAARPSSVPAASLNGEGHQGTGTHGDVEIVDLRKSRRAAKLSENGHRTGHTNGHSRGAAKPVTAASTHASADDASSNAEQIERSSRIEASSDVPQPAPATQGTGRGPSLEEVKNFLLTVVVDLTGYSPEVIDFDADLEADLGVDSIKKAQIVGELAECFEMSVAPAGMKMSDLQTLGDIAALGVEYGTSRNESSLPATSALHISESDVTDPIVAVAHELPTEPASFSMEDAAPVDLASIERFLIDLVVDQTGYSPDVVDLDADMEGDLGIDSIKQAQLLGEVQQQFDLQAVATERHSLTSFPTLRSILNFLAENLPENGATAFRVSVPEPDAATGDGSSYADVSKKKSSTSPEGAPATVSSPQTALVMIEPGTVRGVVPSDELDAATATLFQTVAESSDLDSWTRGWNRGQQHRQAIRAALRLLIDQDNHSTASPAIADAVHRELSGLAAGAGVSLPSVLHAHLIVNDSPAPFRESMEKAACCGTDNSCSSISAFPAPRSIASEKEKQGPQLKPDQSMRFAMRIARAPQREGMSPEPVFTGAALVVGDNPIAREIQRRFEKAGRRCSLISRIDSLAELDATIEKLWASELTPHLFITTSHDADALQEIDAQSWKARRFSAVEVPYRVCQLWMQRMIDEGRMDGASVVAVMNMGGDFGFSGETCISPEGGLGGLMKAMLIEAWMRGFRATPMKVIDLAPRTTPEDAVAGIWRELAIPSYDMEVALHGRERYAIQPVFKPLKEHSKSSAGWGNGRTRIKPGGVWVVTGGARGITSMVVRELAKRHGLKLHLLGTAPEPQVTDELRKSAAVDRLRVRRAVMADAAKRNQNGMEAWRNVEKSLEIDATLRLCQDEGVEAHYHSCDVSNLEQLQRVLERIRRTSGPIEGVIHGAGIGQDARFDRKRADKVDQCLRAKIDGCINLMDATRQDQLSTFVAFGSISGRFGANGHTDYSFANDSLAKLVDRYRRERPQVASTTFHWHAWGDIGMATKPETKLALEMINLEFMPAKEGLAHFLDELEIGGDEPEVLITDRAYYRKFFPVDRNVLQPGTDMQPACFPLLDPEGDFSTTGAGPFAVEMNPERERFLSQHLVQGKPTLPFVMALEMMAEAARSVTGDPDLIEATQVEALQAIKWSTNAPLTIHVQTSQLSKTSEPQSVSCALIADVRRRDGRIVAKDRTYFQGHLQTGKRGPARKMKRPEISRLEWIPIEYLEPDAPIYHGPDMQCLLSIALGEDQAYGLISASSTVQLGGGHRPTFGWSVHPAAMDACLYAAALFVGKKYQRPSLPVRFERIVFGRLPDPGEPCIVAVQIQGERPDGLDLTFQLIGHNGDLLLDVSGYQIGWLL